MQNQYKNMLCFYILIMDYQKKELKNNSVYNYIVKYKRPRNKLNQRRQKTYTLKTLRH